MLDRGKLIVGTGSTNAPWHFEDEKGELVGMDIAMARILAKGLFDDETKVEFVRQDPAARIPNITTGKVDIVIQFMTVTPQRAQLVNFTRPYYVEGVALLTRPDSPDEDVRRRSRPAAPTRKVSILQNVDAEQSVQAVLPQAQVMQIDTQANVIQALEAGRVDAAAVDLSTVRWMAKRQPDRYADAGKKWYSHALLRGAAAGRSGLAALRQHDLRTWRCTATRTRSTTRRSQEFFGLEAAGARAGLPDRSDAARVRPRRRARGERPPRRSGRSRG